MSSWTRYLVLCVLVLVLVGTVSADCDAILEINATDDGYSYGQISYPGGSLAAIRATSGTWGSTSSSVYAMLLAHNNTGNYSRLYRDLYIFNTSSIPDGSVICNATISATTYSASSQFTDLGAPTYGITGYDSTAATIGIYDFDKRLDTPLSDNLTPAAATSRNNWTLNTAGIASINKTSPSHFMMRSEWDIFNTTANLTWSDSANTTFRVYSLEDGAATGRQPVMRIAYNSSVETLWNTTWNQNGTDTLPLLPANHIARYNISELPVHASSTGWINAINTHGTGGNIFKVYMGTTGANVGKKIMYVGDGVRTTTPLFDRVLSQSDVGGTFDWPNNPWWDAASGDGNMYVFNRDTRLGYEFSYVDDTDHPNGVYPNGTNVAGTGNIYNYTNLSIHRPLGTSAGSVSGMQRIPLLLSYADINSTTITHGFEASWYTTNSVSSSDYLWPASATTTYAPNSSFPPMGARFRLNASTDLSHLQSSHPQAYKVALALRDYGGFLNIRSGTDGLRINGEADVLSSTDNSALQTALPVTAFEFVDESSLMLSASSYAVNTADAPVARFYMNITSAISSLIGAGGYTMGTEYNGEPIGGGTGYSSYYTEAAVTSMGPTGHVITSESDFVAHMDGGASEAASGDVVFLPNTLTINLTGDAIVTIPAGVTVASDRGYAGSSGATITKTGYTAADWIGRMIDIGGNNVRITGLILRGEMLPDSTTPLISEANYLKGVYNYGYTGLVVDNNEIVGWSYAGLEMRDVPTAGRPVIKYNHIHDNIARGEGYGVEVWGGDVLFEGNYCNGNRHTITGTGKSGEKYEARYNIFGYNGTPIGGYHVDVHETIDGTTDAYSYAGSTYLIHHNTINNNATSSIYQMPFVHITCDPQVGAYIYDNEILTDWGGTWVSAATGLSVGNYESKTGVITQTKYRASVQQNVTAYDNQWRGVDYADNTGILWYQGGT